MEQLMAMKAKSRVWTIEFDGHPPIPLKNDEIGTVGWTPPDNPGLPWDVHVPVVFSHYEFKLGSCPLRRGGQLRGILRGPDGVQPGIARRIDYSARTTTKGTVETWTVVFTPESLPDSVGEAAQVLKGGRHV